MNICIAGGGTIGFIVAEYFSTEGHNVTVIEHKTKRIKNLEDRLDVTVLLGSATDLDTLRSVNIASADMFFALTDDDEANIIACTLAKHEGVPKKIARLNEQFHISEENVNALRDLGVDEIIDPEESLVNEIARLMSLPGMTSFMHFMNHEHVVFTYSFDKSSAHYGKRLADLQLPEYVNTLGYTRLNKFKAYDEDILIDEFMYIYISCPSKYIKQLYAILQPNMRDINRVMIFGGGYKSETTGARLANVLGKMGIRQITLVLDDEEVAEQIAKRYDLQVLVGDPSKPHFARNESLDQFDAFVGISDNFEKDLFACLVAYQESTPYTYTMVRYPDHVNFVSTIPLTSFLNPALTTANKLMKYHRADSIISRAVINYEQIECIEFMVKNNSKFVGKSWDATNLNESTIIAVKRDGAYLQVDRQFTFQKDDHVLILLHENNREIMRNLL